MPSTTLRAFHGLCHSILTTALHVELLSPFYRRGDRGLESLFPQGHMAVKNDGEACFQILGCLAADPGA